MKRLGYIWLVLLFLMALCGTMPVLAQSFVGVEIAGHSPVLLDRSSGTKPAVSYGGEIGFVYLWQKKHFFLQTGIGYALQCPSLQLDSQHIEQNMIDTRGVSFLYRGTLNNRSDRIVAGQLTLPLYVGALWKGWYVQAGLTAVLNLHANSTQTAKLKTSGDYQDRYYEWLENVPNHGYHDYLPVRTDKPVSLKLYDLRAGMEIGYSFYVKKKNAVSPLLRIGAFAEYGIMTLLNSTESATPRTQPDYSRYMNVDMTHIYFSADGANAQPHMITCGIRLAVLFPASPSSHDNTGCMCYTM